MSETLVQPESSTTAELPGQYVKFARCDGFMATLRERVEAYFVENNLSKRDCPAIYLKTAIIIVWLTASYVGLLAFAGNWIYAVPLAASLGMAMAAVGFNIQHDGGHGSYSRFPLVNKIMAYSLDVLGGSSFFWKRTHNVVHHSYTNVTGVDGDIDLGILGRLSPHQQRRKFHGVQHYYLWFLYGFLPMKWQFRDDFQALLTGRVLDHKVPRPKSWDLVMMLVGKCIFLTLAFAVPLYFHPWYVVATYFFAASFVQGVLLSVVFQLAHCVEEATFPLPESGSSRIENAWAVHQVETTVDFARDGSVATWLTGGLNFQIEHHLFPQICHIHYPAISKIVEQTANEFGVPYHAHKTTRSAIRSHFNWLKQMGRPSNTTAENQRAYGSSC